MTEQTLGTYKCTASNSHGKKEKHIALEEGVKPQPPEFIELHGENSNLLDLGIHGPIPTDEDLSTGMDPKWYNVEYRRANAEEEWSNREFNISQGNDTEKVVQINISRTKESQIIRHVQSDLFEIRMEKNPTNVLYVHKF